MPPPWYGYCVRTLSKSIAVCVTLFFQRRTTTTLFPEFYSVHYVITGSYICSSDGHFHFHSYFF